MLIVYSDGDSGSSITDVDDDIGGAEEDENENSSEHSYEFSDTVPDIEGNDVVSGNIWTENFNAPHTNAHIIFNADNEQVGMNPDLIDTMSTAGPCTFFFLILTKKLLT